MPAESPYQDAKTIRALFLALLALKYQQKYKDSGQNGGTNRARASVKTEGGKAHGVRFDPT